MAILWSYLRPYRWLIVLSLVLAAGAQLASLVDPIIFGKLVDEYALRRASKTDEELISGALQLLALGVGVALLSRLLKAMQEYVVKLVVQKFGMQITDTVKAVSLSSERITILIAHRLSTIMHANTIFVQKGLYYAMWRQLVRERGPSPVVSPAGDPS